MPTTSTPGPTDVYAALWLGALLVPAGELPDPLPPQIEELARAYFEVCHSGGTGTSNVAATTRVVAGDELMLWSVPEKLPRIRPPAAEIASIVSPHAGSTGLDGMYWGADMGRYVM